MTFVPIIVFKYALKFYSNPILIILGVLITYSLGGFGGKNLFEGLIKLELYKWEDKLIKLLFKK